MQALIFRHSVPRQIITKLLSFASPHALTGRTAPMQLEEIPDPALPGGRLARHPHPPLRHLRQRLQAGVPQREPRQPDDLGDLVSAGAGARGGRHGGSRRARRQAPPRRPARGAQPVALVRSARLHHALPRLRARRLLDLRELRARATSRRASTPATRSAATGGFAPLVPAHESMAIPIPDDVSDEAAVLADPFSVSLHAILKRPPDARTVRAGLRLRHARAVRDRDPAPPLSREPRRSRWRASRISGRSRAALGASEVLAHEPADALIAERRAAHGRRGVAAVVRQGRC